MRPRSRLADFDWTDWDSSDRHAIQHATLLFVVRRHEVLLIRKKRGLGAGKINGPGGKLDPGETPLECAVREVEEEVGVTPIGVRAIGEIRFQFVDGLRIWGYVFRADDFEGTLVETDEAIPLWFSFSGIPYAEMWPDDAVWLPWLITDRRFEGRVLVGEGDSMLDHDLHLVSGDHAWSWE